MRARRLSLQFSSQAARESDSHIPATASWNWTWTAGCTWYTCGWRFHSPSFTYSALICCVCYIAFIKCMIELFWHHPDRNMSSSSKKHWARAVNIVNSIGWNLFLCPMLGSDLRYAVATSPSKNRRTRHTPSSRRSGRRAFLGFQAEWMEGPFCVWHVEYCTDDARKIQKDMIQAWLDTGQHVHDVTCTILQTYIAAQAAAVTCIINGGKMLQMYVLPAPVMYLPFLGVLSILQVGAVMKLRQLYFKCS